MDEKTRKYRETMNLPLRPPTNVKIQLSDKVDSRWLPSHDATIDVNFTGSDIIETHEYWEIEPLSRSLPKHTLKFSVSDPDNKYPGMFEWSTGDCRALLTYMQTLSDDSIYKVPTWSLFYVINVTHRKGITKFDCEDVMYFVRKAHSSKWVDGITAKTRSMMAWDITDALNKQESPWFCNKTVLSVDPRPIVSKGNLYQDSAAVVYQKIANAQGACLFVTPHFESVHELENINNDWRVRMPIARIAPDTFEADPYVLTMSNILKDGITPRLSNKIYKIYIKGTNISVDESSFKHVVEDPLKRPYGVTLPCWESIKFQGLYSSVKIQDLSSATHYKPIDAIRNVGLDGCEVHWSTDADKVGRIASLLGLATSVSEEEFEFTQWVPGGDTINVDNSFVSIEEAQNYNLLQYGLYRHELTIQYRGDPYIKPMDQIDFEYEDGKKVSCLVLSNSTDFNGSLKGELKLKVLLADYELGWVLVKPHINARVVGDVVGQIEADTYSDPRMCAFAYDKSGKVIARVYEPKSTPLTTGIHTVSLDVSNHPGQTDIVVYGIYGTTSTLVYAKPVVNSDVIRLDVSINILNSTQGQIKWNQNQIIRVTGGK